MNKLAAIALAIAMTLSLAACGGTTAPSPSASPTPSVSPSASAPGTPAPETTNPATPAPVIDKDRQGNPIILPEKIEKIMCFGPSTNEVIADIGEAGKLVAIDTYSADIKGIDSSLPQFSMMTPDTEKILALGPDVVFVTGMSKAGGDDPFKAVSDAGVCVIYIPSSSSIAGIKEDIAFISDVLGHSKEGAALVKQMEDGIDAIKAIGSKITEKKAVYMEVAQMYSFGSGVFLNEMLELIGAKNIFAGEKNWISVSEEQVLSINPDVILTTTNYIKEPVADILNRDGWDTVTAVANGDVYYIDTNSSNRSNHHIVKALNEMASAIYPELYK